MPVLEGVAQGDHDVTPCGDSRASFGGAACRGRRSRSGRRGSRRCPRPRRRAAPARPACRPRRRPTSSGSRGGWSWRRPLARWLMASVSGFGSRHGLSAVSLRGSARVTFERRPFRFLLLLDARARRGSRRRWRRSATRCSAAAAGRGGSRPGREARRAAQRSRRRVVVPGAAAHHVRVALLVGQGDRIRRERAGGGPGGVGRGDRSGRAPLRRRCRACRTGPRGSASCGRPGAAGRRRWRWTRRTRRAPPRRRRGEGGLGAGAAGVLPLGLGGQAVDLARLRRQPAAVLHGRVVGDADGRLASLAVAERLVGVGRASAG